MKYLLLLLSLSVYSNEVKDMYVFEQPAFVGTLKQFEAKFKAKLILKESYEAFSEDEAVIVEGTCVKGLKTIETKTPLFKVIVFDYNKQKSVGKSVLPVSYDKKSTTKKCK